MLQLLGGAERGELIRVETTESDEFYTPEEVRIHLPAVDLDPCSPATRPVLAWEHYVLAEGKDGLQLPWYGTVYMNPPYSRGHLPVWTTKARREVQLGRADMVIGLIPARPGSAYYRDNIWPCAMVGWYPQRIAFEGGKHGSGMFDSAFILWPGWRTPWLQAFEFLRRTAAAGVIWTVDATQVGDTSSARFMAAAMKRLGAQPALPQ